MKFNFSYKAWVLSDQVLLAYLLVDTKKKRNEYGVEKRRMKKSMRKGLKNSPKTFHFTPQLTPSKKKEKKKKLCSLSLLYIEGSRFRR